MVHLVLEIDPLVLFQASCGCLPHGDLHVARLSSQKPQDAEF